MHVTTLQRSVGELLREWREHRRLSQLELALQAEVSTRHLSFVETGRAAPSRDMVLRLAEQLEVPLRERNVLLLTAGFAPVYAETAFDAPRMFPVREAIRQVLVGHEPYPAVVVDRHWNLVDANSSVALFTAMVPEDLLAPPLNVLRVSLHPSGMAPHIVNLGEWRAHLLDRLGRQAVVSGDPALFALHEELAGYPGGEPGHVPDLEAGAIAVPLRLRADGEELAFISTATTFGTATDVTVSELAIESFFPADEPTATALQGRSASR